MPAVKEQGGSGSGLAAFNVSLLKRYAARWRSLLGESHNGDGKHMETPPNNGDDDDDPPPYPGIIPSSPPPPFPSGDKKGSSQGRRKPNALVLLAILTFLLLSFLFLVALFVRARMIKSRPVPAKSDPAPIGPPAPPVLQSVSSPPTGGGSGGGGSGSSGGGWSSGKNSGSGSRGDSAGTSRRHLDTDRGSGNGATKSSDAPSAKASPCRKIAAESLLADCVGLYPDWGRLNLLPGFQRDQEVPLTKCQRVGNYQVPDTVDPESVQIVASPSPCLLPFHSLQDDNNVPQITVAARILTLSYRLEGELRQFGSQVAHQWTFVKPYDLSATQINLFTQCALDKLQSELNLSPALRQSPHLSSLAPPNGPGECSLFTEFVPPPAPLAPYHEPMAHLELQRTHSGDPGLHEWDALHDPKLIEGEWDPAGAERLASTLHQLPSRIPLYRSTVWRLYGSAAANTVMPVQRLPYNFRRLGDSKHSITFAALPDATPALLEISTQALSEQQNEELLEHFVPDQSPDEPPSPPPAPSAVWGGNLKSAAAVDRLHLWGGKIALLQFCDGSFLPRPPSHAEDASGRLCKVFLGNGYETFIFRNGRLLMIATEEEASRHGHTDPIITG